MLDWRSLVTSVKLTPETWLALGFCVMGSLTGSAILLAGMDGRLGTPAVSVDLRQPAPAAAINFSTNATRFSTSESTRIAVRLDSGGAVLKEGTVALVYDPSLVSVESFSTEGSACAALSEQRLDAERGRLTFVCSAFNGSVASQMSTLASVAVRPLTSEAAVLAVDMSASRLVSIQDKDMLKRSVPLVLTPAASGLGSRLSLASEMPELRCVNSSLVKISWLKPAGIDSFAYEWTEAAPSRNPSVPTVSTSLNLPLKPGMDHFLSIRPIRSDGTVAPATLRRVVSCPQI